MNFQPPGHVNMLITNAKPNSSFGFGFVLFSIILVRLAVMELMPWEIWLSSSCSARPSSTLCCIRENYVFEAFQFWSFLQISLHNRTKNVHELNPEQNTRYKMIELKSHSQLSNWRQSRVVGQQGAETRSHSPPQVLYGKISDEALFSRERELEENLY